MTWGLKVAADELARLGVTLPEPDGEEWERALKIAEAVYYRREPPALKGAMYYHADYIQPSWAKEKKQVARIGRHIFYR